MFWQYYSTNNTNCEVRLEMGLEKHLKRWNTIPKSVHLRKEKKISGFLAMCAYREASGQERKIEHPSHRTLFILLSPALNREVLSKCHDSEKNKFLLISFSFPISAFRSLRVSPDWEAASFSKSALQSWWCEEKEHHLPLCLPQWGNGYFADLWVGNAGSCFMA